jgi:hypothetical protein
MKWFWAAMNFLTVMPLPAICRHTDEDFVGSVTLSHAGLPEPGICSGPRKEVIRP